MEYKFYNYVRNHLKIPFFIRVILACFLMFISIIPIILPIFPGSLFVGVFFLIIGVIFIVPANKIKHVVKIRKGIIFLFKNLFKKNVVDNKVKDIKGHIKDILNEKY